MKILPVILFFLLLMHHASAQKPPHLVPVTITEMVPVEMESQQSSGFFHADTNCRFIECRTAETTVGYLIEPKVDWWWYPEMKGTGMKDNFCHNVGLREVQRAETVFANTMDRRADLADQIQRPFTAPYFYQYIRQYAFYLAPEGDTCVHIECLMPGMFGTDASAYCHIHVVCDGDDNYWTADLNLTQGKLLSYDVNGPTYYYVEGRNDEPCGLYEKTLFARDGLLDETLCQFNQLPATVKKAILSIADTAEISSYHHFSHIYTWKCRVKKNGKEVSKSKKHKIGNHYRIFTDTISRGFDAKGRLVYVGNEEYLGRLDLAYLNHIAEIDTIMEAIGRDLLARGCDFGKYGYIQWEEQVGDHYVLAVIYDPPIPADFLRAYYTFDRKGRMEGVTLFQ